MRGFQARQYQGRGGAGTTRKSSRARGALYQLIRNRLTARGLLLLPQNILNLSEIAHREVREKSHAKGRIGRILFRSIGYIAVRKAEEAM